jgi:hypothetical protein
MREFSIILLCAILLFSSISAAAMETDQYHLPRVPLADIGDQVSEHVENVVQGAIRKINSEIAKYEACLTTGRPGQKGCRSQEIERTQLLYLRSNDAVARETYEMLGSGTLVSTKIGKWMYGQNGRYKTGYRESIYVSDPIDYLTISPTVNLYGVQFGIDKLEHLFQQGYRYYGIYQKEVRRGADPQAAAQKAVRWGRMTERTYFGLMVSGVFSNGDLVANYAGMKFYQGLTNPIRIGDSVRPAIVVQENGYWLFNPAADLRQDLLRPFITEHLNEAMNPSIYAATIYPAIRHSVKSRACSEWITAFPEFSKASAERLTNSLALWNGEDYGHQNGKRMVTIGETCFSSGSS